MDVAGREDDLVGGVLSMKAYSNPSWPAEREWHEGVGEAKGQAIS